MNFEQIIILVLTIAAAAGATASAVAYARLAPWWLEWIGRMYLALHVTLAVTFWLLVVNRALNGEVTRTAWIFVGFLLAAVLWGHFFAIIHTQRQVNKDEDTEHHG
jgi:hypothetical protein